eukprot:EG_transcript_25455
MLRNGGPAASCLTPHILWSLSSLTRAHFLFRHGFTRRFPPPVSFAQTHTHRDEREVCPGCWEHPFVFVVHPAALSLTSPGLGCFGVIDRSTSLCVGSFNGRSVPEEIQLEFVLLTPLITVFMPPVLGSQGVGQSPSLEPWVVLKPSVIWPSLLVEDRCLRSIFCFGPGGGILFFP